MDVEPVLLKYIFSYIQAFIYMFFIDC